ncbi:U11/U12 small nuclear ribonucleoprotein 35 kDa protein [Polypterus senegalus]
MNDWSPIATVYDPLKAGSIDGTDLEPHDRAVWRAMVARYVPNKGVIGDAHLTLFVARISHHTTEEKLRDVFSKYGSIKRLRLIRDLVTGSSKGYAFIEYNEERSLLRAHRDANKLVVDQHELFVDFELERTLKGWIPRRLGGGLGGKKESGQLRFGGRDRPFRKPISVPVVTHDYQYKDGQPSQDRSRDRWRERGNRWRERSPERERERGREPSHRDWGKERSYRHRDRSRERDSKRSWNDSRHRDRDRYKDRY